MRFNRRRLLFLSGFSIVSLGVLSKFIRNQNILKPSAKSATAFNHSLAVRPTLPAPILRFISVADTGTGDRGQYAVARAMNSYHSQNPYELVILAGDNIYNNGEIEKRCCGSHIGNDFRQYVQSRPQQIYSAANFRYILLELPIDLRFSL